jgi:hypothetical protein
MTGLVKTGKKGELAALCSSACKLNLLLPEIPVTQNFVLAPLIIL